MAFLDEIQAVRIAGGGVINFGATSTTATALMNTGLVRLNTTAPVSVLFGGSTTSAATTDTRIPADGTEYFRCNYGQTLSCKASDSGAAGAIGVLYYSFIAE